MVSTIAEAQITEFLPFDNVSYDSVSHSEGPFSSSCGPSKGPP